MLIFRFHLLIYQSIDWSITVLNFKFVVLWFQAVKLAAIVRLAKEGGLDVKFELPI